MRSLLIKDLVLSQIPYSNLKIQFMTKLLKHKQKFRRHLTFICFSKDNEQNFWWMYRYTFSENCPEIYNFCVKNILTGPC